jgi:hypothetical protein
MPEIGTSSLMSGEGKRIAHAAPRLSSTLQRERTGAANPVAIGHFSGAYSRVGWLPDEIRGTREW